MSAPLVPQPPQLKGNPREDAQAIQSWMNLVHRNIEARGRDLPDPLPDTATAAECAATINAILRFLKGT